MYQARILETFRYMCVFFLPSNEKAWYDVSVALAVEFIIRYVHAYDDFLMLQEYFKRIYDNKAPMQPTSDWFILHIHGGGFISQTSESHQMYLKDWSRWTDDTPILSIDYSLAPEAPYPRALEEILYAYVWALNNCERLGTTAKRVVFAGL